MTGTLKHDHITPALRSLHWLPVPYRIHFKIVICVFKSLQGIAPLYIADLIHVQESNRSLRSNGQTLIDVPRSKLKLRGAVHSR